MPEIAGNYCRQESKQKKEKEEVVAIAATERPNTLTKKELEGLLVVDEKTGLYNFREFRRRLREEWARASRYDHPLSLVFLDIDDLDTAALYGADIWVVFVPFDGNGNPPGAF